MKNTRRMVAVLLCVLVLAALLTTYAMGAGAIVTNRDVSLTVSYQGQGSVPLVGARFDLYLIAGVDAYGQLTPVDAFSQFNVDIRGENAEAWKKLASTLEGYILWDGIAPTDTAVTDQTGLASFPTNDHALPQGLYLVMGECGFVQEEYRYDATSFLVMLPTQDMQRNEWQYAVAVQAKQESNRIPDWSDGPELTTRKVLKIWDDQGHQDTRPKEIVVQLLRNGAVYDTVTLCEANNWRYTWAGLDPFSRWNVVEKACEGYDVEIIRDGGTFVITNTYDKPNSGTPGKPSGTTLPQTGQLWWPVPILSCAGLLLLTGGLICRKKLQ